MSMVDIPNFIILPEIPSGLTSAPTYGAQTFNSLTVKVAFVFDAPKTGNISNIHWRVGTVTTSTAGEVRLETIDLATGRPSGTLVGANTYQSFASVTANTNRTDTLIASASVTKGQRLAVVVVVTGATVPNWSLVSFTRTSASAQYPCLIRHTTSWTSTTFDGVIFGVGYDDGTYPPIMGAIPINNGTSALTNSFSTNTNPDHDGIKFTVPFRCRVTGAWWGGEPDADCNITLYGPDGYTALATRSIDAEEGGVTTGSVFYASWATPVILEPNTTYRLAVNATTTTAILTYPLSFASEALKDGCSCIPKGWHRTRHNNTPTVGSVSWTDTLTEGHFMGLIIDQIDAATTTGVAHFG